MWSDQGGPRDDGTHTTTLDFDDDGDVVDPADISHARYTITLAGAQGVIDITHVEGVPEQLPSNGHVIFAGGSRALRLGNVHARRRVHRPVVMQTERSTTMRKTSLILTTLVAAAATLPASASAQSTASCQFSVGVNMTPGVQFVAGGGDYTTMAPAGSRPNASCTLNGQSFPSASIFSQGSFTNVVCGTGEAWSDAGGPRDDGTHRTTLDANGDGDGDTTDPADISSRRFTATFVGWVGVIDITHVEGVSEQLPRNGRVTLVPAPGESCAPSPLDTTGPGVNAVTAVGEFVARW